MAQQSAPRIELLHDADKPLVLVGPPRAIRGQLNLRNSGDEKVIVRQPRMRAVAASGKGKARIAALREPELTLRRIVVRAGQARQVPIALSLVSTTPPGTYHAELDVDGEVRNVVVHVVEDVSFSVEPREIVLPNRPGEKFQKRLVIQNTGNVPLKIKPIGTVVLDEELVHCRALRGALADVGATMKSLDDFVVALGRRYHDLYDTRVLKVQNDSVTVEPGAVEPVDLTIAIPDKLDAGARYTGFTAISTQSLTFTVVPE